MKHYCRGVYGGFPKIGVPVFGGPHSEDYSIRAFCGSPLFWETTIAPARLISFQYSGLRIEDAGARGVRL